MLPDRESDMQTSSVIDPQEPLAPRSGTRPWIVAGVIVVSAWLLWAFALTPSAARSPDRLGHDGAIQTFDSASAEHSQAKTEASAPAAPERRALAASASSPDSTSIRGHVVAAETGAPLARANVHLGTEVATERGDAPANWTQPADVVTGDDGLFTFAFVPPATLRFHLDVD